MGTVGQGSGRIPHYSPSAAGPNAGTVSCGGAGRAGGGESRAPAGLHFNWRRQRTARSPRPGGEPWAVQTPSVRGGDPSARLAGWLRRAGRAQPEGVNAIVHLAYCTHVCAGPARATAPEPLEPGPSLGIRQAKAPSRAQPGKRRRRLGGALGGGARRGGQRLPDKRSAGG